MSYSITIPSIADTHLHILNNSKTYVISKIQSNKTAGENLNIVAAKEAENAVQLLREKLRTKVHFCVVQKMSLANLEAGAHTTYIIPAVMETAKNCVHVLRNTCK
jgi:hypothetical protein